MTGFGTVTANNKDWELEVSVKSVNSRFLEVKFYTALHYMALEPELKKIISQQCQRGYFVVRMDRFPPKPLPDISPRYSQIQAKKWKSLYNQMSKEMNFKNDLTLRDLIPQEGVIQLVEKAQTLTEWEKKKAKESFQKAFRLCLQERKREGSALKKDIFSRLKELKSLCEGIQQLNKKQIAKYMRKKSRQTEEALSKNLALELEKFDIHEELIRIKEHLAHFKKIMSSPLPIGRKMDFYIQEILREMNTMGSKSQLSNLTLKVVEGKFVLEKIKEQAQNIE